MSILSLAPAGRGTFENHYGLEQRPFALTLDQRYLYPSASYVTSLNEVLRALQRREGLVVVTGASGTGKTMFCRTLLQQLTVVQQGDSPVCVSVVLDPRVSIDDLLLHVLTDFGVTPRRQPTGTPVPTRHQLMRALQQFLASLIPMGAYAVLVVDEAQDLDEAVLDQLRLLLNFETDDAKLLQVVLIGQPNLDAVLQRPSLRQLDDRVARRCELHPLGPSDVAPYIEQRLAIAAPFTSSSVTFTEPAVHAIAQVSHGVPRVVNLLCDRALEIGFEQGTRTIDAEIIRVAETRLPLRRTPTRIVRESSAPRAAVVGAALLALGVGFGTWTWAGDSGIPPARPSPPAAYASAAGWVASSTPAAAHTLPIVESIEAGTVSAVGGERARLARVSLVRSGGRTSLAFQLTAEPQKAALQFVSDRALDVEVGPLRTAVEAEELTPSAPDSLVKHVSVRGQGPTHSGFARARVVLAAPARGDVRVVGRTVYVDLIPTRGAVAAPAAIAARAASKPEEPIRQAGPGYNESIAPTLARLAEIRPFLTSAVETPTPAVLDAMAVSLAAVDAPLRTMTVAPDSRPTHTTLLTAVATASRAVAPDFSGNRVAQVQRAFALVDSVKQDLNAK